MSTEQPPIHLWHQCHHCGSKPIIGTRYHCESCPDGPDSDLCETCYRGYRAGEVVHPSEESLGAHLSIGEHRFQAHQGKDPEPYEAWLKVARPPAPDPDIPDRFLIRPEFVAGRESYFGGYAFAADLDGQRKLVVTALHIMDEMIKAHHIDTSAENRSYTGRELPAVLSEVRLYDVLQVRWMLAPLGSAGPMLALPNARTGEEEPNSWRDIAAFELATSAGLRTGPLAPEPPAVGTPVWLAVRVSDHRRCLRGVVVAQTAEALVYRFDGFEESPRYASGAPLVDFRGRVVGINVGRGHFRDRVFGHANHVGNIRKHLAEAL